MELAARIAFIQAQTVCALAEIESMKAANRQREIEGNSPAYNEQHFLDVPNTYQIGWNSVIEYLRD